MTKEDQNKNYSDDFSENDEYSTDFDLDDVNSENEYVKDEIVEIPKSKLILLKKISDSLLEKNKTLNDVLSSFVSTEDVTRINIGQASDDNFSSDEQDDEAVKIVEGVFDGENMIGPDGKVYSVPSNYASKSKLVEGDIMKLTITRDGTFVYKQIGPIERKRVVGILEKNNEGNFTVEVEGKRWRTLNASVTYFKGNIGDEVILLVPKIGDSKWGAVENIVKNSKNF